MIVRRFHSETDYREVCQWWKHWGRVILSPELLPVLGFICEDEGQSLAACWLYCSDSLTGFVGWTTVNPNASKKKIRKALDLLRESTESSAQMTGLKILFQFSGGRGFSRLLVKSGWKNSMIKHDLMLKEVGCLS